jgi:hypothetical protein
MILHFDKLELRTTIASVKRSKKGKKSINMLYSANPTAYQHDVKDKQQIISLIAPQEVAKVF